MIKIRWKCSATNFAVAAALVLGGCVDLEDDPPETSDTSQQVALTLASLSGGAGASDLIVHGTYVYWTRFGDIFRVSKSGGAVSTICTGCGADEFAVSAGEVYYTIPSTDNVAKISTSGGFPLLLATSPAAVGTQTNVVVDGSNVYWVGGGNTIYRTPIGGGSVTTVYAGTSLSAIADDASNVYTADGGLHLKKISKTTLAVTNVVAAWGTELRVFGGAATWRGSSTELKRVSTSGGAVTTFSTGSSGTFISSYAVDATHNFFIEKTNSGSGNALIRRFTIASPGTPPTTILMRPMTVNPAELQSDGSFIYWSDADGIWKSDP